MAQECFVDFKLNPTVLNTVWRPNRVAQGFVRADERLAVETAVAA